jgi:uncharacterized membrane protein YgcG
VSWLRIVTALLLAILAGTVTADERILRFQGDIQILADSSMEVTETITVRAEGQAIKRGIYRDFPTVYRTAAGNRMSVLFEVIAVRRDDVPEPWFSESRSNGVRVYIGREERMLEHGEYTYEIVYRTDRQLGYFEHHDELYWNVTGNGWSFPIDAAVAYVYLPRSIADEDIGLEAYTGAQGQRGRDFESGLDEEGVAWFRSARVLAPGEGLTIVTTWPKGHVREPTAQMRARWFLADNGQLLIGLVGAVLLLAYYGAAWLKAGRDPEAGVVFPRYEPPNGYSPASLRFVQRMGYDARTFTAALVNLAVAGHVEIEEGADGYTVERRSSDAGMAPGEKALLDRLLGGRSRLSIERGNHARIASAMEAHRNRLEADYERIYFNSNPGFTIAGVGMSLALLVAAVFMSPDLEQLLPALFLLLWLTGWSFGTSALIKKVVDAWRRGSGRSRASAVMLSLFALPFVGGWLAGAGALVVTAGLGVVVLVVVLVGINAAFYHLMKAPTLQGRALLDQVQGFQEYLGVAEADELSLRNPPEKTPELFERYLPHAIALGVEEVWGERFASTLARAARERGYVGPGWYHGRSAFSSAGFTSAVASGLASSIAASSRAPGSSSGSSMGGGGGGSSGGGGGGGGGGGW